MIMKTEHRMKYAKSINEVAAIMPRDDGGIGLGVRQTNDLLKLWGITKAEAGWPIQTILKRAREHVEGESVGDDLDAEIKRRKIKLLDIEIGRADETLADVAEVSAHFEKLHADFAMRLRTWRETLTSKHPQHHALFDAAFNDLMAMLKQEAETK